MSYNSKYKGSEVDAALDLAKTALQSAPDEVAVTNGTEPTEADIWIDTSSDLDGVLPFPDAPADSKQYARKNNTWEAISLSEATTSEAGLMSAADKIKLNNAVISDGTVLKVVYVSALPDSPDSTTLYIIPE